MGLAVEDCVNVGLALKVWLGVNVEVNVFGVKHPLMQFEFVVHVPVCAAKTFALDGVLE